MKDAFKEFLSKENEIYDRLERTMPELSNTGLKKNPHHGRGGYAITLRHNSAVTEQLYTFTSRLNASVESTIIYRPEMMHTTLTDHSLGPIQEPNKEFLKQLADTVYKIAPLFKTPTIQYTKLISSSDAIIAKGEPSPEFLDIAQKIQEQGATQGIELRLPWGAHITLARFNKEHHSPIEISHLINYLNTQHLNMESKPTIIDVGYHYFPQDKDEFIFNTYEQFELQK